MNSPIDSFSIASSSLVELLGRDRWMLKCGNAAICATLEASSKSPSKMEPWPIWASCWVFAWRSPAEHREHALGTAPVEPNAPHFTSASIAFLFTARASTRAQKSQIDLERAAVARSLDRLHGCVAHALHGIQSERMLPSTTTSSWSDRSSGGRSDAHRSRLVGEERHLVLGVHDARDQRRHVLGRVVRLQPRRPVGDERVARRV